MEPFLGFIEAPSIDICDSRNNIRLATGYKFALGCAFGACDAILWSLLLEETMIHQKYAHS
ncbi:hypothetical protein ACHAW5_000006 [Stephanodiscus triporus]|uniref:Uncharacterized protein n=1 Tax=Stephanodiscus triporus TaxID=2934178 RepID=A0ABD3MWQ1_9STRA